MVLLIRPFVHCCIVLIILLTYPGTNVDLKIYYVNLEGNNVAYTVFQVMILWQGCWGSRRTQLTVFKALLIVGVRDTSLLTFQILTIE